MITYFHSTQARMNIRKRAQLKPGSWVRAERPSDDEKNTLVKLGLDSDLLNDALDPHEVPRVELENGWVYFITRLPDTDDEFNDFTTPILFALGKKHLYTVSRDSLERMWGPFIDKSKASTVHRIEFFMLMLEAISRQYQTRISTINRQMRATTSDVHRLTSRDITTLTEYERKLNDYLDALVSTNTAIEKILSGRIMPLEGDRGLVEDVSIEFEQLIARCKSLLRTITNVRDSYRAVMDTRLNETIRLLTVITLALAIPTMFAGLYGMNVDLPGESWPLTFWAIVLISIVLASLLGFYFLRKRR